jgi:proline dehydrogenase
MGFLTNAVLASLPYVPTPIMRRLSARYIAGETLGDAIARLAELRSRGYLGVLDILGEDVRDEEQARRVLKSYQDAVDVLVKEGLDAYVSVKPTHLGLRLSSALAFELYSALLTHCRRRGHTARIEVEDHTTTDATLELFSRLRAAGYDNVGIVLQARLFRTPKDIEALPTGPVDVRLVKGIYLEPPSIAHVEPEPIREAFLAAVDALFARGHRIALATHDQGMAARALELAAARRVPPERYYFEVLMGVQEPLWARWRDAGHTVRIYVPFGPEWRPYSTRRLRKNPQILGHVMRNVFRR